MTTVAIIAEYNPFHSGHEYHIKKIREEFGEDTSVIVIMSGNYTQRGELAIVGKDYRAECAVKGGADLVLELPFPFSSSSAEIFAKSGVKIADSLGIVDYISFGSESGDIASLKKIAYAMDSEAFKEAFRSDALKDLGYPERCELAFKTIFGNDIQPLTPNNILAIEYIRALDYFKSSIKPHTVKRYGSSYDEVEKIDVFPSAMFVRSKIMSDSDYAFIDLPVYSSDVLSKAKDNGDMPTDIERIFPAVVSSFRLNSSNAKCSYHDAGDGLYNRLRNASFEAVDIKSLLEQTLSKNYTRARVRRAILNVFFGVTSSNVKTFPCYTQVLAMNKNGMLMLKKLKEADFPILNKPSNIKALNDKAIEQKLLSDKADSIYELSKPIPKSGRSAMTFTPYVEK